MIADTRGCVWGLWAGNGHLAVADIKWLARFIVSSSEFRDDGTVRPKLFMPYKRVVLSVNRHRDCTDQEIWRFGYDVARKRKRRFYGRSDIQASSCRIGPLDVNPVPLLPTNPNHADVTGFPSAKEDQQALAIKLAASASNRITPAEAS